MHLLVALLLLLMSGQGLASPAQSLVTAARKQIGVTVTYDGSYRTLRYPGGDVPLDRGVCTDVVIRAYRELGIDLQRSVHEDMRANWAAYPTRWGLKKTDTNIDHRRVPNLAVFFQRHGTSLPVSTRADAFKPGDIVTWNLPGNLPHIGIITDATSSDGTPLVIHNIGAGTQMDDILFAYEMVGHYRYQPARP